MFPSGMSEAHAQILLRWVNCTCFVLSDKFFFVAIIYLTDSDKSVIVSLRRLTMTPVELSHPIYHDEDAARAHIESIRWPNGPICPHCGVINDGIRPLAGQSMGSGWYYCASCKDKFTVRMGAIYERSHLPLHKWLLAFRLMASSKKGFSAHQLSRTLNVQYKTAWFVAHRIREAMAEHDPEPFGGKDKIVEVDEMFQGPANDVFVSGKGWQKKRGTDQSGKSFRLSSGAAERNQSRSRT